MIQQLPLYVSCAATLSRYFCRVLEAFLTATTADTRVTAAPVHRSMLADGHEQQPLPLRARRMPK
jgi:hypothetical protein